MAQTDRGRSPMARKVLAIAMTLALVLQSLPVEALAYAGDGIDGEEVLTLESGDVPDTGADEDAAPEGEMPASDEAVDVTPAEPIEGEGGEGQPEQDETLDAGTNDENEGATVTSDGVDTEVAEDDDTPAEPIEGEGGEGQPEQDESADAGADDEDAATTPDDPDATEAEGDDAADADEQPEDEAADDAKAEDADDAKAEDAKAEDAEAGDAEAEDTKVEAAKAEDAKVEESKSGDAKAKGADQTDPGAAAEAEEGEQLLGGPLDFDGDQGPSLDETEGLELYAQASELTPYDTANTKDYVPVRTDDPHTSAVHKVAGTLERVEYVGGKLIVERLASDLKSISSQKVISASTYKPSNLASTSNFRWGGFFSGSSYNFVVTGQTNSGESASLVVYRITKYSKDWAYLGSYELKGANTVGPFVAGNVSMVESGGNLYVRTCHEMFKSSDGYNHQANVEIVVNESSMALVAAEYGVMNQNQTNYGYVSHSFAQRQAVLSNVVFGLDLGDAHPRAVTVKRLGGYNNTGNVLAIPGSTGDNYTGVTLGGFESSSTTGMLLSSGASINQAYFDSCGYYNGRNAYIAVTNPSSFTSSVTYLTSYDSLDYTGAMMPKLVKLDENRFLVLWTEVDYDAYDLSMANQTGKIGFVLVDGNGNKLDSVKTASAYLSDCDPVVYGDKVVWYTQDPDTNKPMYWGLEVDFGIVTREDLINISEASISSVADVTYDGSVHKPKPTLTYKGRKLGEGTDYTLGYDKLYGVGSVTITAKGIGRFTGCKTTSFTIKPASISSCTLTAVSPQGYTGKALTPNPKLTFKGTTLVKGTDYTLSYKNNTKPGTATITITGKGCFTGTRTTTFKILPGIADATIAKVSDKTYTGSAIKPQPKVTLSGKTLKAGTDFTYSYKNNVNAGTATITVTGKGGYAGTKKATFAIKAVSISKATLTKPEDMRYTGEAVKSKPTLTFNGKTLVEGTDYTLGYKNNVKAGSTATVTITGKGNFTGSRTTTFAIGIPLSDWSYMEYSLGGTYTGKPITGWISIEVDGKTLKEGRDYTVSYRNNVNAGTATIVLTGKGAYVGTLERDFTIYPADIAWASIAEVSNQRYTGKAIKPTPKVTYEGKTLKAGTDYTLSYKDNTKVGTATIVIKGKGNFSGSTSVCFQIVEARPEWTRYAGKTAIDTGKAVVEAEGVFEAGRGGTVVLATSGGYWDALAAAGLAGRLDAPVLITPTGSLAPQTREEIARLKPKHVVIVGGRAAVSAAVESQVRALVPDTTRVSGKAAPDTAVEIYRRGSGWGKTAIVATSNGYWDALSIAPFAFAKAAPIFLTTYSSAASGRTLPASAVSAIRSGGFTRVVIVGGKAAVPASVEAQLRGAGVGTVTRLSGATAIDTSGAIGRWEVSEGMGVAHMAVATGGGYWDALTGAAVCGKQNSVLVLVNEGSYQAFDAVYSRGKVRHGHVLGGRAAVSDASWRYVTTK